MCVIRGRSRRAGTAPGLAQGYHSAFQAGESKVVIRFFLAYYNRRSAFGGVKMVEAQSVSASNHQRLATDLSVFTERGMRIGGC